MQPQPEPTQDKQPTRVSFVSDFLKPKQSVSDSSPSSNSNLSLADEAPVPDSNNLQTEPTAQTYTTTTPATPTDSATTSTQNPEINSQQNPQHEILEQLRDERDSLRGTDLTTKHKNPKKVLLAFGLTILAILTLSLSAKAIFSTTNKEDAATTRQAFVLPADLEQKPAEERQALTIINLARKNQADTIIKSWLGQQNLSISKEDFSSLVESYSSSADGSSAELLEKQVGESDLGVQNATKVKAASLVYKSNYYEHTNNIYLKLNLYQPTESPSTWKLYGFEFKAEQSNLPLKAEL